MEKRAELTFKISYLLLTLISFNVFFARQWFVTYLSYAIVIVGLALGVMRLLHFRDYLNAGVFLLLFFTLSYVLGSINTYQYGIVDNIKAVIWMLVQYFLLFAFDKNRDYSNERDIIFKVLLLYVSCCSMISMILMAKKWQYETVVDDIYLIRGGFIHNRLFGCYTDPNYGAVLSVVAIIIAVFFIVTLKNSEKHGKTLRIVLFVLLSVSIILNFLYICYSGSRTGMMSAAASVIVILTGLFARKSGKIKTFVIVTVSAVLIVGMLYVLRNVTSNLEVEIAKSNAISSEASEYEINRQMDLARIGKAGPEDDPGYDFFSGRLRIWKNAVEIFSQHPLLGISFRNVYEYATVNIPTTFARFESMHNAFFDILVSQGILGVLLISAFFVWALKALIDKNKSLVRHFEYDVMLAVAVAVLVSTITYSEVFYMNTGGAFVFWYSLGYLINLKEQGENTDSIEKKEI